MFHHDDRRKEGDPVGRILDEVDLSVDLESLRADRKQLVLLAALRDLVMNEGQATRRDIANEFQTNRVEHQTTRREADSTRRLIRKIGRQLMATVAELQAGLDAAATASAATDAEIAKLAGQVQVLIDNGANGIDPADLDPIVAGLNALAAGETAQGASVDAVLEVEGEDGPPPPPPEPPI